MKIRILILLNVFLLAQICPQAIKIPEYYSIDNSLSDSLNKIVSSLNLDKTFDVGEDGTEQISLAVIDLNNGTAKLGGVNMDNFIYPASVYKMYVAAQILSQVFGNEYSLYAKHIVKNYNAVDGAKEILGDPRPLLKGNDTVTINYLLDLMITRSDNSAANCLIDVATRPRINKMMHELNWQGSEVTRKFLKRKFEDAGYDTIRSTVTCALHAADFMYRVFSNQMINPWVSQQLKCLLGRQLDKSKIAAGLPKEAMYYHKTGWYSFWTNDVGLVDDGKIKYIISCFIPLKEEQALPKMKEISQKIYQLIKFRNP
ncbi:MAG: class A beta-lactamase-related serine hydrolase [Ignavibacteriales bacterium]|nr:class A beta-lactamase-related serine hydrolase [Ignavibacteriales bacterium]